VAHPTWEALPARRVRERPDQPALLAAEQQAVNPEFESYLTGLTIRECTHIFS